MGIIPEPIEYGANCDTCYASGETPLYFKAFFSGMKRGSLWTDDMPGNMNGYYDITQDPTYSCRWRSPIGTWQRVLYEHTPTHSYLTISLPGGWYAFTADIATHCGKWFANAETDPSGNIFYGGEGVVMHPSEMAAHIEKVTPLIDPDPRMELFTLPGSQSSIRYAGKRDATRISIVLDI